MVMDNGKGDGCKSGGGGGGQDGCGGGWKADLIQFGGDVKGGSCTGVVVENGIGMSVAGGGEGSR